MDLLDILRQEEWGMKGKDSLFDKELFNYWYEKGKTNEGAKQTYILYVLANNPEVRVKIIDSEDDVCDVCRNKPNGKCAVATDQGEKRLPSMDRNTARFYGFECGKTYSAKEIFETLKQAKKVVSVKEALAA